MYKLRFFYLLFITFISSADREVSHFIRILAGGNNSKVITQLLLLQVSLGQVLELTFGESKISWAGNSQLCAISCDDNIVGCKSSSLSVNLDLFLKVCLKESNIQDLIVDWLCAVNDEFNNFLSLNLMIRSEISPIVSKLIYEIDQAKRKKNNPIRLPFRTSKKHS